MIVTVPVVVTLSITLPDDDTYNAVHDWLTTGELNLVSHDIASWTGNSETKEIVITAAARDTDIDTSTPILAI